MTDEHSQIVCLRLIDEISQSLNHHCSLCLFLNDDVVPESCVHSNGHDTSNRRPFTPCTEASFHTAVSTPVSESARSTASDETSSPNRTSTTPRLRRRASPTHISLRDLEAEHARALLRAKQSEEQLQRVYESQVLQYLNGAFACLPNIDE